MEAAAFPTSDPSSAIAKQMYGKSERVNKYTELPPNISQLSETTKNKLTILKKLKDDNSIVIKRADISKDAVVWETSSYETANNKSLRTR
ncbi:hypothetical protein GJ496_007083 [Pomphorhynchus laevis]|nr:hypothetical protein GJ496_007083 [Pomphorhynchus laevis]